MRTTRSRSTPGHSQGTFWSLDEKQTIVRDVEAELELPWRQLNVVGTREVMEKYLKRIT